MKESAWRVFHPLLAFSDQHSPAQLTSAGRQRLLLVAASASFAAAAAASTATTSFSMPLMPAHSASRCSTTAAGSTYNQDITQFLAGHHIDHRTRRALKSTLPLPLLLPLLLLPITGSTNDSFIMIAVGGVAVLRSMLCNHDMHEVCCLAQ